MPIDIIGGGLKVFTTGWGGAAWGATPGYEPPPNIPQFNRYTLKVPGIVIPLKVLRICEAISWDENSTNP